MSNSTLTLPRWFNTCLWGNTVAFSWMWGLGLFFSVQFTSQFGLFGLLSFAIPNFLGLLAFGLVTHHLARRQEGGSESLGRFFIGFSRPFRLVFFLYQVIAITLTIFALINYGWRPLQMQPDALYLPLTLFIALAAATLFGEEFNIKRIKWSHGAIALIVLGAVLILLNASKIIVGNLKVEVTALPTNDLNYWGYAVPIIIGFLLGPWLDLQQWQRAIQMHRERVSIAAAYTVGSLQFFLMLIFHGTLALWALSQGASQYTRMGLGGYKYSHDAIMSFLFHQASEHPWIFGAYCVFLSACILTTLDSGYIAVRWFLQSNVKLSNSPIFALIPTGLVTSPIPMLLICGAIALIASVLGLELEYFMIFYATFFVGYSALAVARCYVTTPANAIPQVKMFSIGALSVVIFAYGYFLNYPIFMMLGSLIPLGYVIWLLFKPTSSEDFVRDNDELNAISDQGYVPPSNLAKSSPAAPTVGQPPATTDGSTSQTPAAITPSNIINDLTHNPGGHFEGKWFVHSFVATYGDTNSVGNVYFGMYAMWVGKTRELFFNHVMPKFNLKNSPYYILTRSFEHKFMHETREFETVSVRIRIANYNRKFVTLEHEIYDTNEQILGKGKQSLLFVSSSDYHMIDVPADVTAAFIKHV
ncbi:MAG: acyl-CoA thioesterase [Chthoniobacterales bacterium]